MPTHYEHLLLQPTATEEEIRRAYQRITLQNHPDKTVHLPREEQIKREEIVKQAINAYAVLRDPAARAKYDGTLPRHVPTPNPGPTGAAPPYATPFGHPAPAQTYGSYANSRARSEGFDTAASNPTGPGYSWNETADMITLSIGAHEWTLMLHLSRDLGITVRAVPTYSQRDNAHIVEVTIPITLPGTGQARRHNTKDVRAVIYRTPGSRSEAMSATIKHELRGNTILSVMIWVTLESLPMYRFPFVSTFELDIDALPYVSWTAKAIIVHWKLESVKPMRSPRLPGVGGTQRPDRRDIDPHESPAVGLQWAFPGIVFLNTAERYSVPGSNRDNLLDGYWQQKIVGYLG